MFWLKLISKLIRVLRSGESPSLIAGGFTMGFFIGLTPFWTLQNMVILAVAILTKINLSAVFFSILLFGFVAYFFDPLFHSLGYFFLVKIETLYGFWTSLYNWPLTPYARFNNTVVMGSLIIALLLATPVYFVAKQGIVAYRRRWAGKVENWKFVKHIKGTALYNRYEKVRDLRW